MTWTAPSTEDLRERVEAVAYPPNMPRAVAEAAACECFHSCNEDGSGCSLSGDWHQHEDWPCIVHPDAEVSG